MNELLKENCNSLNEVYTFWYHNPDNVDWSLESYIELLEFKEKVKNAELKIFSGIFRFK
jgi:hypothetical protein